MENKVTYTFTRQQVAEALGETLTDKQWEVMASELEDLIDYYFYDELPRVWADIDEMVAQDSKFD